MFRRKHATVINDIKKSNIRLATNRNVKYLKFYTLFTHRSDTLLTKNQFIERNSSVSITDCTLYNWANWNLKTILHFLHSIIHL